MTKSIPEIEDQLEGRALDIALRIDCARMSLAPSSAVASGDLPSPCFLRSLSG